MKTLKNREKLTNSNYNSILLFLFIGVLFTLAGCDNFSQLESGLNDLSSTKTTFDSEYNFDDFDEINGRNLYVQAGAPDGGDGTKGNPFNSLADVEANSLPGDKITVLYSGIALDGGIALKEGQHLQGKLGPNRELPQITNSSPVHLDGDAVRLTGGNIEVDNLHILDLTTFGSGITSRGIFIEGRFLGNDDSGDFHLHDLLITNYGGRAISLLMELSEGETLEGRIEKVTVIDGKGGAIEIFTDSDDGLGGTLNLEIDRVVVDNIDPIRFTNTTGLRLSVFAQTQMNAKVTNSRFDNIRSGGGHREGILIQHFANAISFLEGVITPLDPTLRILPESAVVPGLNSSFIIQDVSVSNNEEEGIQVVTAAKDVETNIIIEGSTFENIRFSGIIINEFDPFGTVRDLHSNITIRDNLIKDTGRGIFILPSGLNSTVDAIIENNDVVNSTTDGLHIHNHAVNAVINVDVLDNTITDSRGLAGFIAINDASFASIDELNVKLEGNDILRSFVGLFISDNFNATNGSVNFDFGGGVLGSDGQNRFVESVIDAFVADFAVVAENNWWGSATGPATVILEEGGSLDFIPFLTSDPEDDNKAGNGFELQSRVSHAQGQFSDPQKALQEMLQQKCRMLEESLEDLGLNW